jgi:hypothetical protein
MIHPKAAAPPFHERMPPSSPICRWNDRERRPSMLTAFDGLQDPPDRFRLVTGARAVASIPIEVAQRLTAHPRIRILESTEVRRLDWAATGGDGHWRVAFTNT